MKLQHLIIGIILFSLIIGLILLISTPEVQEQPAIMQGCTELYALDIALPLSPETAPIYKIVGTYSVSESNPKLMSVKERIPSESEAPHLAEKILEDYEGLPEDAKLSFVEEIFLKKYNGKTGTIEAQYPQWTSVHYSQELNGFKVIGPGAGIIVDLGENGEMLGISKSWREVEYAGEVPVISAGEAYEKLKNGESMIVYQSDNLGLRVSDIRLGYYAEYINVDQEYYTPVWLFYAGKEGQTPFPRPVDAVKT